METRKPLTEGKKTNKDLAEWFGVRPQSFSNKKESYLEKLKKYAEYTFTDKGKIEITKVIIPYYNSERAADVVKSYIPLCWNSNGYDKNALVAKKIQARISEEDPENAVVKLKDNTVVEYTRNGCKDLYGTLRRKEGDFGGGTLGFRKIAWCKEEGEGHFVPLTPDQLAVFKKYFRQSFGSIEESESRMEYLYSCVAENEYEGNEFENTFLSTAGFNSKEELSSTFYWCKLRASEELGFPIEQCIQVVNYADVPKLSGTELGF